MPVGDRTQDRARLGATAPTVVAVAGIGFPYAAKAVQVTFRRRGRPGRWRTETAYAVTSLAAHQAGPADLGDAVRGHWTVDNRLSWVRDVTFEEDRSQVRTGNRPRIMASLPNLAITAIRLSGVTNVATAFHDLGQIRAQGRLAAGEADAADPSRRTPTPASWTSSSAVSNSLRGSQESPSAGMQ